MRGGDMNRSDAEMQSRKQRMLENIANSNARIQNQHKDEIDLTFEQKYTIVKEMFQAKPVIFVERFHKYLCEEDLDAFVDFSSQYEVMFYLEEAKKRLTTKQSDVRVKNRRYEALRKLEREGVYFGDDAMNSRAPFMYNDYVGQYLTDAEKEQTYDRTDLKFSTILMDFMDRQDTKALYKRQKEDEECMDEEEEEEEEEEEVEEETEDHDGTTNSGSYQKAHPPKPVPITEEEKKLLREEFLSNMRERFLSGQDEDFDYTTVDYNTEYDSVEMRTYDEQEKYFDEDD